MKKILSIALFLFILVIVSQAQGRWIMNPLSGQWDYSLNTYSMADSLINLGYGNTTAENTLNTIIGFNNYMNEHSIALGFNNQLGCAENYVIGKNIRCNSDKTMTIGSGEGGSKELVNQMPGSLAFGFRSVWAPLHIHSGYSQAVNTYQGNIGGVRIGHYVVGAYNTDSTALEIHAHRASANLFTNPSSAQFIATENDEWTVGMDAMAVAGSMSIGYMECDYVPRVYSGAADTSLLPTPFKVGDYFINTTGRDVYISTGSTRGSWKKLN